MVVLFAKWCKQARRRHLTVVLRTALLGTLFGALISALSSCSKDGYQSLSGATMGTYYRIQADCPVRVRGEDVDERLRQFNAVFSTYESSSELAQLNLADLQQWRPVSPQLMSVLEAAQQLYTVSGGAFDPTIGSLVNLWGFGPDEEGERPDARTLAAARVNTGYSELQLDPGVPAIRSAAKRTLDLSAIAKGRAVDELAMSLAQLDCSAALIDIGGEIRVFGNSPAGRAWRLAIEQPGELRDGEEPLPVIVITDGAVATSGDYRNYRELEGRRLSHLIDPRSAEPISHGLASVTVWHPEAMWADGYATAINVLGPIEGQVLANRAKLAVAMLVRTADGRFEPWMSDAFVARFVTKGG